MEEFKLRRILNFRDKNAYFYYLQVTAMSYTMGGSSFAYGGNSVVYGGQRGIFLDTSFAFPSTIGECYIFNGGIYRIDEGFKLSRDLKFKKPYIVGTRNQFSI
jgi:hypothetical protein